MLRTIITMLVVVALQAFGLPDASAQQPRPKAQPQPLRILGVTIPDRVAGLRHDAPYDYEKENPGLGYSVRFERTDWAIHVYVYDMRLKDIPDGPSSELMQKQLAQATAEIDQVAKSGAYSNVKAQGGYIVNDRTGRPRFTCSAFTYFHKQINSNVDSQLCLTGFKGKFFKIRATGKASASSTAEAKRFISAWADALSSQ